MCLSTKKQADLISLLVFFRKKVRFLMKELKQELKKIEKKETVLFKNKEIIEESLRKLNLEKSELLKTIKEIERHDELRKKAYEEYKRKKNPNEI